MQSDFREICRLTSERTGKAEQLYKDIGTMVFTSLAQKLRNPKTLIFKLKGVGSWHLRRRRMQILMDSQFSNLPIREREEFSTDILWEEYKKKIELRKTILERLEDYERYISERDEVRKIRYKTQKLIEPIKDEEEEE